jgi:hypothetical protein
MSDADKLEKQARKPSDRLHNYIRGEAGERATTMTNCLGLGGRREFLRMLRPTERDLYMDLLR